MKTAHLLSCIPIVFGVIGGIVTPVASAALSLEQAVHTAISNDPWLDGSLLMQKSLNARSKQKETN